jgi:hypothetical protein
MSLSFIDHITIFAFLSTGSWAFWDLTRRWKLSFVLTYQMEEGISKSIKSNQIPVEDYKALMKLDMTAQLEFSIFNPHKIYQINDFWFISLHYNISARIWNLEWDLLRSILIVGYSLKLAVQVPSPVCSCYLVLN